MVLLQPVQSTEREFRCPARSRRGAMMVLIVILLPVLFLLSAFAINIAYIELVRTELQIATDAAGRAAGSAYATTGSQSAAFNAAKSVAERNTVAGAPFSISMSDLEFGLAVRNSLNDRYSFSPSGTPNAVQLTTNSFFNGGGVQPFLPGLSPGIQIRSIRSAVTAQVEVDIALVIDRSGSMAYSAAEIAQYPPIPAAAPSGWTFGDPVPPNARWLDTIAAVNVFLQELNNSPQTERVSLVTFSHWTNGDVYLNGSYTDITNALTNYSYSFQSGGTAIGDGIYHGLSTLNHSGDRDWASKVVVVMTDGIQNYGSYPVWAAQYAAQEGVLVFTITFSNEADVPLMQWVASEGKGLHYHAVDANQLRNAFQDIARRLPTLLTR